MPSGNSPIREAQLGDWDFVQALYCEATKITHPNFNAEKVKKHVQQMKDQWLRKNSYSLIYENFTSTLGVIWVITDKSRENGDYVQLVAVEKKSRKKGVGTALLLAAVERSQARERLSLRAGIHKNNPSSLSLFKSKKCGFRIESDEEDLKLYVRDLFSEKCHN